MTEKPLIEKMADKYAVEKATEELNNAQTLLSYARRIRHQYPDRYRQQLEWAHESVSKARELLSEAVISEKSPPDHRVKTIEHEYLLARGFSLAQHVEGKFRAYERVVHGYGNSREKDDRIERAIFSYQEGVWHAEVRHVDHDGKDWYLVVQP